MTFGERVKAKRVALGLSQADLAISMGFADRSAIAKIEKGQNAVKASKILDLARALHTTPSYLYGWDDDLVALGYCAKWRPDGRVEVSDASNPSKKAIFKADEYERLVENGDLPAITRAVDDGSTRSAEEDARSKFLEAYENRPEMRMLFKLADGWTKEDVETAVKLVEALKSKDVDT